MRVFDFTNVYSLQSYIYEVKTSAGVNPHTPNTTKKRSAKTLKTKLVEMAIFIASTKSISRSNGQSAVASASYRAGVELEDKRYGRTHDYSKKHGVMSADIILPSALADAKATVDRGDLWNKAEAAEKRVDARVAREWLVNLPHELSAEDRKELAHQFAQTLADRYGTIADCAIHQPTQKEIDRGADPRNFHAHILFTTRTAELDDNFEIVLKNKATIELSDNKRRSLGLERVSEEIKEVRKIWEQTANDKLAEHDHKLVDSRSYAAQGKNIEPQIKMGSVATKLERDKYEDELKKAAQAEKQGEVYEIDETPATIRGEINAMIAERNELVRNAAIAENQRINDPADQVILEGKATPTPFDPPKPKSKPNRDTQDALQDEPAPKESHSSRSASQSMLERLRAKRDAQNALQDESAPQEHRSSISASQSTLERLRAKHDAAQEAKKSTTIASESRQSTPDPDPPSPSPRFRM